MKMQFSAFIGLNNRLGTRALLFSITLLAALPALLVLVAVLWQHAAERQNSDLERVQRQAGQAAREVGAAVALHHHALSTMAQDPAALAGDLRVLHAYAQRVARQDPMVLRISLHNDRGQVLIDTRTPYTQALQWPTSHPSPLDASAATVTYRTLPWQPIEPAGLAAVQVVVPLAGNNQSHGLALHVALSSEGLGQILLRAQVPSSWTLALLDQENTIVARTRDGERFVGKPATDSLQAFIRDGATGVMKVSNKEGDLVIAAAARVPGTAGWHVAIGLPARDLAERHQGVVGAVGGAALLLIALSLLVATIMGHRLSQQIVAISQGKDARNPVPELERIHARLHAAQRDALTGLLARAAFFSHAGELLESLEAHHTLAILFMDLDGFKNLNDTAGHQAGDDSLVAVAHLLQHHARTLDLTARLGGDEFVVALVDKRASALRTAEAVANRLVRDVQALGQSLGCSIGVAIANQGETLPELLHRADQAMYQAKRQGRNRAVLAT